MSVANCPSKVSAARSRVKFLRVASVGVRHGGIVPVAGACFGDTFVQEGSEDSVDAPPAGSERDRNHSTSPQMSN